MESANYNPILENLHRMHRQFAVLIDEVNGGILRVRGLEERIAQLNKNLEAALKAVLNQRIAMDQKQAQLEENEKSIDRRRSQLDEAKNDREFTSIQNQIAASEAANAVLSDEILEGLDYLDTLKQKAELVREEIRNSETVLEDIQAKSKETREKAEEKIREMKVEFHAVERKLNGEHSMLYHRLFKEKKFDSLAPIRQRYCTGCNPVLPVDLIASVAESTHAFECRQCGRMLYLPMGHSMD